MKARDAMRWARERTLTFIDAEIETAGSDEEKVKALRAMRMKLIPITINHMPYRVEVSRNSPMWREGEGKFFRHWCRDHCVGAFHLAYGSYVAFEKAEDATAFKMYFG